MDKGGKRTRNEEEVKRIPKEKMETLFQKKTCDPNKPWLHTNKLKEMAEKIKLADDTNKEFTLEEVTNLLNKLDKVKGKATCDNKPIELYTLSKSITTPILVEAFNKLFKEDILPKSWRKGMIYMIFKPGNTASEEEIYDYRPITLLSASYKIYTHLLNARLKKIFEPFFSENQGGFREGKACQHKLLTIRAYLKKT